MYCLFITNLNTHQQWNRIVKNFFVCTNSQNSFSGYYGESQLDIISTVILTWARNSFLLILVLKNTNMNSTLKFFVKCIGICCRNIFYPSPLHWFNGNLLLRQFQHKHMHARAHPTDSNYIVIETHPTGQVA